MNLKLGLAAVGVTGTLFLAPMAVSAEPIQGSSPCLQGGCPSQTTSAADAAIHWTAAREGSTDYDGLCLKLMSEAYAAAGIDLGVQADDSAWTYWQRNADRQHTTGEPPRGALVFWAPDEYNEFGHVALAIGDGRAWSSMERQYDGVHWLTIAYRNQTKPYLGYIVP